MTAVAQPITHNYRGAFEVHLTATITDATERNRLQNWCAASNCKCVWIVLARGEQVDQPMATWHRRSTVLPDVLEEANKCAEELTSLGIDVSRVKIEAAPTNAGVPRTDKDCGKHLPTNYFEHHIKLLLSKDTSREALVWLCESYDAHLSRNAFRDNPGGNEERFATLRSYDVGAITAERRFQNLLAALRAAGEHVLEAEAEYCVYDSAVSLDAGWLEPVN